MDDLKQQKRRDDFPTSKEILDKVFETILPQLGCNPDLGMWPDDEWDCWSWYWDVNIWSDKEFNYVTVYCAHDNRGKEWVTNTKCGITIYRVKK